MITRLLLVALLVSAHADRPAPEEYHVKGAFLLNFAKFVDWPDQAFKGAADPIAICVVGRSPFGPEFERAAQQTFAGDRTVIVREVPGLQQAPHQCHVVFVTAAECKHSRSLLRSMQESSILTVGECDGFTDSGGVIAFNVEGERIRIEINAAAATRAKLHISAKLLSLAQAERK